MKVIGSCGFGSTGSSVLTDLLREYDDVQVYDDFEFSLCYRVDGLQDLEYHIMKQYSKMASGDYAIKRFMRMSKMYKTPFIHKPCNGKKFEDLSTNFIKSITQIEYLGVETADVMSGYLIKDVFALASKKVFMPKVVEKITKKRSYLWPCRTLHYSIRPENFYSESKKYINEILKAMGVDPSIPVCLDQPFEGNQPEQSFPFFDDPYAVVIDRDPRDLFLAGKYTKSPNFKFSPSTDVEKFIIYYRNMRRTIYPEDKRVLRLKFEDFIYNYNDTIVRVEDFLGIKNHTREKEFFDPLKSLNNTQLIRLHPEDKKNIERIESELPEFLYPFGDYKNISFNGRPFDGASRKAFEQ